MVRGKNLNIGSLSPLPCTVCLHVQSLLKTGVVLTNTTHLIKCKQYQVVNGRWSRMIPSVAHLKPLPESIGLGFRGTLIYQTNYIA